MTNGAELMQDEEFMNKFLATQSAEEAVKLFAENGVEITAEELTAAINAAAEQKEGELEAEELDNVAGGISWVTVGLIAYGGYKLVEKTGSLQWWNDRLTGKKKW